MKESIRSARRELRRLRKLRSNVVFEAGKLLKHWESEIAGTPFVSSAENLAAYLAFRRADLRAAQSALSALGVSSLGRSEAHVLATLDAVIATLAAIAGERGEELLTRPSQRIFSMGTQLLKRRADALLGAEKGRPIPIMVTLPASAATDRAWVRRLVAAGTNCVRINCAHDTPEVWEKMIRNVRSAAKAEGRACKVLMDLCGPRARIESILHDEETVRVKKGDSILLTKDKPRKRPDYPLQARCLIAEVFTTLKPGAQLWINEGRIGALVVKSIKEGLVLRVTDARETGEKIRAEMALNFPNVDL